MGLFKRKKKDALVFKQLDDTLNDDLNTLDYYIKIASKELATKLIIEKNRRLENNAYISKTKDIFKTLHTDGYVYDSIAFNYGDHLNLCDLIYLCSHFIVVLDVTTLKRKGKFLPNGDLELNSSLPNSKIANPVLKLQRISDELKRNVLNNTSIKSIPVFYFMVYDQSIKIDLTAAQTNVTNQIIKFNELDLTILRLRNKYKTHLKEQAYQEMLDLLDNTFYVYKRDYKKKFNIFLDKDDNATINEELFNELIHYRKHVASKLGKEPYRLIPNSTLQFLVNHKPITIDELDSFPCFKELDNKEAKLKLIEIIKKYKTDDKVFDAMKYQKIKEELINYRIKTSFDLNVKPYMIFTNEVLENIIKAMPQTEEEFLNVSGLGKQKYLKFGQDIIEIIKKYV